ncbi:MAG: IS1634 family transposase [Verrucomicrobiota bacterium]|nr:IS1634 family transposase [Verrucomicrobiota bacterium]
MKIENPPAGFEALEGAEIYRYGHLPVAAAFCRRMGLIDLVNSMVKTEMKLPPGEVVQAMVLDTLSQRSPLYRLESFLEDSDEELLMGKAVDAKAFGDVNIGRSMDAVFKSGPSKIITALGARATRIFDLDTSAPSYDTTSTNVWGDYRACENGSPPEGSRITYGYSKDHRPDLKQFMTELLCVDRGVPIFGKNLDGNSSDQKSNNAMLSRISSIMALHGLGEGAFVYVADSSAITEENLGSLGDKLFLSRLPARYNECGEAIARAVNADEWVSLGRLSEIKTTGNRPSAEYKCHETTVTLYGKEYRALVVHSSTYDKRRQKKCDRQIADSEKKINTALKKTQTLYACETDAKTAAAQIRKHSSRLHTVAASVFPVEKRKPGRPPKEGSPATRTHYEIKWDLSEREDEIARLRSIAGCFVLVTNAPDEGEGKAMGSATLLRTYKGQYGVENDFSFLKDPLIVNDTFLKTPSRIDVLGMVLIIALMIWRLMERSMRTHVKNTGKLLPGWCDRPTDKPTSFMMSKAIVGITVARKGRERHLLIGPAPRSAAFLKALGVSAKVYTDPRHQCTPITPRKSA